MSLSLAWVAMLAGLTPAAPVVQQQGPAALRTEARLDDGVLALAFTDQLPLLVEVIGDAGLEVRPPQKWVGEPWKLDRLQAPQRERMGDGRVRWSQPLWLEPLAPGEVKLQLEPLSYRQRGGSWQTVAWQPLTVRVQARLTDPDINSARDIVPIEEVPAPAGRQRWQALGAAVLAALALLVLIAWRFRRRAPAMSGSRSLQHAALRDLDRLIALRLPERGKGERFGTLLAGLLRRYLERKHGLPARRQTTAEFLAALEQVEHLEKHKAWLEQFLGRCDQIKFAPVNTTQAECDELSQQLRAFLTAS
jgi:hypothetical protein